MRSLLYCGKFLLFDMASTVVFLSLYLTTRSLSLAVGLGIALGLAQLAWEIARRRPIDTMQWVSLLIVLASGTATLVTHDVRFMMLKLSVFYLLVGAAMCKPGWIDRYLPPVANQVVPDIAQIFGFVWAGLMFFSAALNLAIAEQCGVAVWAEIMSVWGTASKLALFLVMSQFKIGPLKV